MSSQELKTKRRRHEDRVTLDQDSLQRVDAWIVQVTSTAKGVNVARKEVVNWLVKQHDEQLSTNELNELKSMYFSEVRFLQQAIRELKAAKHRGEPVTLEEILGAATNKLVSPSAKRRRSRRRQSASGTGIPENADASQLVNVLE